MKHSWIATMKVLAVSLFVFLTGALYLRGAGDVPDFLKGVWAGVWIGLFLVFVVKKQRSHPDS